MYWKQEDLGSQSIFSAVILGDEIEHTIHLLRNSNFDMKK